MRLRSTLLRRLPGLLALRGIAERPIDFIGQSRGALRRRLHIVCGGDRLSARRESRRDNDDFYLVGHVFFDAGAENHVGGIIDYAFHQFRRLTNFVQREIVAAHHV